MRIISLIPARGGSKRLPNKNMLDFGGRSLVGLAVDKCKCFSNEVWVTTDSDDISSISISHGANVIKRPDRISCDNSTPDQYLNHFLNQTKLPSRSVIILCQPTSPLVPVDYYRQGLHKYEFGLSDMVISSCYEHRRCWSKEGHDLLFNPEGGYHVENGAFYIFSVRDLHNNKYDITKFSNVEFQEIPKKLSIDIDTEEDLEVAKIIYEEFMRR